MSYRPSIKRIRANGNALGLTVVLAIGLVIQVVRFVRLGPQLAAASASNGPNPGGAAAPARDVLVTFAAAGDMDQSRQLLAHTEQVVQALKSYPTTRPLESRALTSNPFRSGESGHVKDEAEQERADTMAAAQALTLQSVMKSEVAPVCLINNMLLRENQEVNGFTVDQIKSDAVIVHRGAYRFELRMLHEH